MKCLVNIFLTSQNRSFLWKWKAFHDCSHQTTFGSICYQIVCSKKVRRCVQACSWQNAAFSNLSWTGGLNTPSVTSQYVFFFSNSKYFRTRSWFFFFINLIFPGKTTVVMVFRLTHTIRMISQRFLSLSSISPFPLIQPWHNIIIRDPSALCT